MKDALATDAERKELEQGLDILELARTQRSSLSSRLVSWLLPKVAAVAVLLGLWELVFLLNLEPDYIFPSPWQVVTSDPVVQTWQHGGFTRAIGVSVSHAVAGYAASLVIGTLLGVAIARLRPLRIGLFSLVAALQTLPSVTWVPIGILIFGNSVATIYFVVILGAFPSITVGTVSALDHVSPLLIKVGRSMGAGGFALYRHVVFPAAMPGYLAGLKQAWSFSWRSLMAAELIGGAYLGLGLGQLLHIGQDTSDMTVALAAMFAILLVGLTVEELCFAPLDRLVRSRRGLTTA